MGKTTGSAPTAISDLNRRSHLFVKYCREGWVDVIKFGVILSVYVTRES